MSTIDATLRRLRRQLQLGNNVRALELAGEAYATVDAEGKLHLKRIAAWIASNLVGVHDRRALAEQLGLPAALAAALTGPPAAGPRPSPAPHAVEALLVDVDGSGEAFVVTVVAERAPARPGVPRDWGGGFVAAVEHAELAVLRLLRAHQRWSAATLSFADVGYRLQMPPLYGGDEGPLRTFGGSLAAATAVAAYAALTAQEVPAGAIVSGALGGSGELRPVAALPEKIAAALRERPGLSQLLVPRQQTPTADPRVVQLDSLELLLRRLFGDGALSAAPSGAPSVEQLVRQGLELYEKGQRFAAAAEVLRAALAAIESRRSSDPGVHRHEELLARWRLAAVATHEGDVAGATELFARALALGRELWEAEELDAASYFGLQGNYAVLLRDLYRYEEAEALLLQQLAQQRRFRVGKRELAKTLGNLGELRAFRDDFAGAEEALVEAFSALEATYRDELPRVCCYRGNLELRRGAAAAALGHFEHGLALNRQTSHGRADNAAFLGYGRARALLALGRAGDAELEASAALARLSPRRPYPRQLILAVRGRARLALGERQRGRADLRAAADPLHVSGALLLFGVSLALGELALDLLTDRGEAQRDEAREALARLAEAALAVPGLPPPARRAAEALEQLAQAPDDRLAREAVAPPVAQLAGAFPYA